MDMLQSGIAIMTMLSIMMRDGVIMPDRLLHQRVPLSIWAPRPQQAVHLSIWGRPLTVAYIAGTRSSHSGSRSAGDVIEA